MRTLEASAAQGERSIHEMKRKHIIFGLLLVVLIAMLVPAIPVAVAKHRRSHDMATLQKIGMKVNKWSMEHDESFPSLTNELFLSTLAADETAFLTANRAVFRSRTNDHVVLQAQTADGMIALFVDGSVAAIK